MTSEKKELPEIVEDVQKLIAEKYPYLQGTGDLADLLQITPEHLIRIYKTHTGETPSKALVRHKLERAKLLLHQENLYVDTVANLVGFSCGNYFAKVFRKYYGISPTDYAKAHRGNDSKEEDFPELYL